MRVGLIALAAMAFAASTAHATDYYLTSNQGTQALFVDKDTIRDVGSNNKRYWSVNILANDPKSAYMMVLTEMNCVEQTYRTLNMTAYDDQAKTVVSFEPDPKKEFVIPDTGGELQFNIVCKNRLPSENGHFGDMKPLIIRAAMLELLKDKADKAK